MKKTIVYLILSLLIVGIFCGCSDTIRDDGITVTSKPERTNAPVSTPDPDDGLVDDTDGLIDDSEGAGEPADLPGGDMVDGGVEASAAPKSSTMPKSSAAPTENPKT